MKPKVVTEGFRKTRKIKKTPNRKVKRGNQRNFVRLKNQKTKTFANERINVTKLSLNGGLINVEGLTESKFVTIRETIQKKDLDYVVVLETHRRVEAKCTNVEIDGYEKFETQRSDVAGDRAGGGIIVYTRYREGLNFQKVTVNIDDSKFSYVNKERIWFSVETKKCKTAICGTYLGFQSSDDKFGEWNEGIYSVLAQEIRDFRVKGYRVLVAGDLNGHIGNKMGQGIPGNHIGVNKNGERLLNFMSNMSLKHLNGMCKVEGDWSTKITEGLWTRQRGGSNTIIDYVLITSEHNETVEYMKIDDRGVEGCGSDHNWLFFGITDQFSSAQRLAGIKMKRLVFDIKEEQDWSNYKVDVENHLKSNFHNKLSVHDMYKVIAESIIKAGKSQIGVVTPSTKKRSMLKTTLPPEIVVEKKKSQKMEQTWKTALTIYSSSTFKSKECLQNHYP